MTWLVALDTLYVASTAAASGVTRTCAVMVAEVRFEGIVWAVLSQTLSTIVNVSPRVNVTLMQSGWIWTSEQPGKAANSDGPSTAIRLGPTGWSLPASSTLRVGAKVEDGLTTAAIVAQARRDRQVA